MLANFFGRVVLGQFFGGRAKKYLQIPAIDSAYFILLSVSHPTFKVFL